MFFCVSAVFFQWSKMIFSIKLFLKSMFLFSVFRYACLCCWLNVDYLSQVLWVRARTFWFLLFKVFLNSTSHFWRRICSFTNKVDRKPALKSFLICFWDFLRFFERIEHLDKVFLKTLVFESDIKDLFKILSISERIVFGFNIFLFLSNFSFKLVAVLDSILKIFFFDFILTQ